VNALGVVLAAGAGRRFGGPKQAALVGGVPLARRVARALGSSRCAAVAVVVGAHEDAVRAAVAGTGVALVKNDEWHEGIASSIRAGVRWASRRGGDAVILTVADQPSASAAHFNQLLAAYESGAPMAASRYAGTLGTPALFGAAWFPALLDLHADEGAKKLLYGCADIAAIDWDPGALDVDRPADLDRL
jgi:CTP:molybdopterin cytidylyltransferase MocA